ncbi:MAG: MFS transporter [Armatimonadota bacterium]|nr:MFS transporter [Armatimonadota bacterium]MDR7516887.1 MFS transporter [Armatimonadota bacterium]MDR7561749.1 MFS transporter [Armatimonadota bacterium]MDR7589114.1 MFS transporter [Armatimonadota bacterium]
MSIDLTASRRIARTLFAAQSLGSAAVVAVFPIVAIAGARLSGHPSWAGVPATGYQVGAAAAALGWGRLMDPLGRRGVLLLGMLLGVAGSAAAGWAILSRSFGLFLAGGVLLGAAVSAVQLSRFVAAEVHPPDQRGRALSTVVLGGTLGAVLGPLMAGPASRLAAHAGLDELSGPYAACALLFLAGGAVVFLGLRPEPRDLARALAGGSSDPAAGSGGRRLREISSAPGVQVATTAMVFGQLVMVMLMVITPLHMREHRHAVTSISVVISAHVVGMYAFSVISGRLADRVGRGPVILAGAAGLILAALAATLSPRVLPMAVALFLLGVGWNFCYVGGSTLLADQLSPGERARTQGLNDLLIGLASAAGSAGSGVVFAAAGYDVMGLVAVLGACVPLVLAALNRADGPRVKVAAGPGA